eukprot:COSAG03_NODE_10461_length_649_cov_2.065455_1_plen_28_part_10
MCSVLLVPWVLWTFVASSTAVALDTTVH